MFLSRLVLLVVLLTTARALLAQSTLVDAGQVTNHLSLATYLEYVEQDGLAYCIDDLVADQQTHSIPWQRIATEVASFGFNSHPYWFRLEITNSSEVIRNWLLEIKNPVLDDVLFYQVAADGSVVNQARIGDRNPTRDRPFLHHNLILPLTIAPQQTYQLYFRVTTSGALELPLSLWDVHSFQQRDQIQLLLFGALFGILLVMATYNFFIYTLFYDRSLFYYAAYSTGLTLFFATIYGFGNLYLWPDSPWWQANAMLVVVPVTLFFGMLFTVSFLQLWNAYRFMPSLVRFGGICCALLLVLAPFGEYSLLIKIMAAAVFPVSAFAIVLGLHRWKNGYQPARYYILAWSVFLLALSYYVLTKFGLMKAAPFSEYAMQLGAVAEMVLFSFALADRMNSQRRSYIKAQSKALELQRLAKVQLELQVDERTSELRSAMNELGLVNQRLQALSMQDGLTGIYNRRYFDDKLEAEWQRGQRNKDSMALLLIDIDFFKDFNDKYGHLAGDECLRQVARVIQDSITRPSDVVARYGGEEFVVILPDTTADGAMHVAETIRIGMHKVEIALDKGIASVSVSIGVASLIPEEGRNPQDLIANADQALYQAKLLGRNRCQRANQL